MKELHFSKYFLFFTLTGVIVVIMTIFVLPIHFNKNTKTGIPGYIDGKFIYISSNYNGTLRRLYVVRGDEVQANQDLFVLDPLPESTDLDVARANMEQSNHQIIKNQSNLRYQFAQMQRKQALYQKNQISKDEFEIANSSYLQALADKQASEALLNARKAELEKANWVIGQKIVKSPAPSIVYDTYYSEGELVNVGIPVVALLSPEKVRVVFFVSENLLSKMKFNDKIEIISDNYKNPIKAAISFISSNAEFTPPVIYSQEERSRLVYRIEAIPQVKNILQPLHPGQPVSVVLTNVAEERRDNYGTAKSHY